MDENKIFEIEFKTFVLDKRNIVISAKTGTSKLKIKKVEQKCERFWYVYLGRCRPNGEQSENKRQQHKNSLIIQFPKWKKILNKKKQMPKDYWIVHRPTN